MHCYRICRARYRGLEGDGARKFGGRWNSPGRPAVYASASRALAILETLVHVRGQDTPTDLVLLTIEIPDTLPVDQLRNRDLPRDWQSRPAPATCARLGDEWLKAASAVALAVPSVVVVEEPIYLLNPAHPKFGTVRVVHERKIRLDERLVG
jgi:RES domain-containing protein